MLIKSCVHGKMFLSPLTDRPDSQIIKSLALRRCRRIKSLNRRARWYRIDAVRREFRRSALSERCRERIARPAVCACKTNASKFGYGTKNREPSPKVLHRRRISLSIGRSLSKRADGRQKQRI